jgi:plastocyanin
MTWRWLISSSLSAFSMIATASLHAALAAATVTGTVALIDSREASVRKGRDFSGVVVWLEPLHGSAPARTPTRVQMIQKNKRFLPHILPVVAGTTVDFPNNDPIFHNAFSNFDGKVFDIGLYAPGTSRSVRLDRPGIVRVFCNIHPTMSALIAVLPTPYFATSRPDGRYQIPNVPPGEYTLRVVHERATSATLETLTIRLAVDSATATVPPIRISESGYLPVLHKNKYGKDYPRGTDESFYPGAGK